MNRRISPLAIAAMMAGASLVYAIPASAQSYTNNFEATNNPGALASATASSYTVSTEGTASHSNYVKESGTTAGANTNPMLLSEVSSTSVSYNYTSGANFTALVSTTPSTTGTAINGEGTFINGLTSATTTPVSSGYNPTTNDYQSTVRAFDGTQSLMVSYVQNNSSATTTFYRLTTVSGSTNALARPTVDLGGTVSFMVYFDTGIGTTSNTFASPNTTPLTAGSSSLGIEIGVNQSSTGTTLGSYGGAQTTAYILGGSAGNGGTNGSTSTGGGYTGTGSGTFALPQDHFVTNGSWQKVTFDLSSEQYSQLIYNVSGSTARQTSGLGFLNEIDFSTTGTAGQVYNIYIDDITFTAAPEPSEWAGMGIGVVGILALAVRARRRNAGLTAA